VLFVPFVVKKVFAVAHLREVICGRKKVKPSLDKDIIFTITYQHDFP